jgi:type IV pilus assembly protein PilV
MKRVYPMNARAQAGVGLIEVLIALLILSIGMLGMAGLQMWSLQNNQGSMERGMAVMQTHTIADAMRAARDTAINNGFDIEPGEAIAAGGARTTYSIAALTEWRQTLEDNLGEDATGGVSCDNETCTITIRWNDRQAQAAEEDPAEEGGEEAEEAPGRTQELTTEVRL